MSSERALQLFPTMSSLRKKGPMRKASTKYTTKPQAGLPEFEMLQPSGKTNGFIIQVSEGRPSTSESIPPPPPFPPPQQEPQITAQEAPQSKPQPPPLAIPQRAYIVEEKRPDTPPSPLSPSPIQSRAPSPAGIPLPRSSTNTPTLLRSNSNASIQNTSSPAVVSPVMRSIFPKYDPSRPLDRQSYYPNNVPGLAAAMAVAGSSSNNPYRQAGNRSVSDFAKRSVENVRSDVVSVKESPLRNMDNAEDHVALSSPEELLELWAVANGQAPSDETAEIFNLELSCDDLTHGREVITFNSSTSEPIYTLETSHSNITVSRIHPVNRAPTIQVNSSILTQPTAVDPLVTSIFPKLAGLMALDQSSNVAVAHRLDRQASAELQTEAIHRAQEQEASMLLWDDASNKYCLMHPTLLDSAATTLSISIFPTPSNPKRITIYAPETNTPLLELSLQTLTLTLHTSTITALPNLYLLDTLMTCLLTLLLHLHRFCATPRPEAISQFPEAPIFPPPPTLAHQDSRASLRKQRPSSRLSAFRSTKSVKSARSTHAASAYEQDIEMQSLPPHSIGGRGMDGEVVMSHKQKPPKQVFSTDDESLPSATRAVLKLLYWVFELVFWIMNVLVQVLAAGVVGAGKFVTKL